MKKKFLILILSVILVLSDCGRETSERTGESMAVVGSGAAQTGTVAETKEASGQESAYKKETAVSTESPKFVSTKAPAVQNTTGSSACGSTNSSVTVKATEEPKTEATKAPVSTKAPVVQSTPAPTAVPTAAPTAAPTHSHSWDGGSVTTVASCGDEGTKTYSCSCGETKTESIPATSHNWVEEVYGEATCTGTAYAYKVCTICNATGEGWTVPALGHDVETYEKHGGDCVSPAQYGNTCRRCGSDLGDSYGGIDAGNHEWITVTGEVFNEETFKWETVTETKCSRCNTMQ